MMKTFEDQNHYDVLNISANADVSDLKRAYRDALALYDDDALATYSLFSDEQRAELLEAIETAYHTLLDEEQRAGYNQMLLDTGQVDESFFSLKDQKHLAAQAHDLSKSVSLSTWVKRKSGEAEIKACIDALLAKDMVSGADLKAIREALGIEKSEIYEIVKISGSMLTMIENDRFENLPAEIFLKQFLSSFAEILQIDPLHVVTGYLKNMTNHP